MGVLELRPRRHWHERAAGSDVQEGRLLKLHAPDGFSHGDHDRHGRFGPPAADYRP